MRARGARGSGGRDGARVALVGIGDGDVQPALPDVAAVAVVRLGAEHDDARAEAELGVADGAVVVLVDHALLESEGVLQPGDPGAGVAVAQGRIDRGRLIGHRRTPFSYVYAKYATGRTAST